MEGVLMGIVGLLGVALGAGIEEFRLWRQRKERYEVITFEKRLEVHQQALSGFVDISTSILPRRLRQKNGVEEALNEAEKFSQWYKINCLYLDEYSQKLLLEFSIFSNNQIRKYHNEGEEKLDDEYEEEQIIKMVRTAGKAIVKGIGAKYLPDIKELMGQK